MDGACGDSCGRCEVAGEVDAMRRSQARQMNSIEHRVSAFGEIAMISLGDIGKDFFVYRTHGIHGFCCNYGITQQQACCSITL